MNNSKATKIELNDSEKILLMSLRKVRKERRNNAAETAIVETRLTRGQRIADKIAAIMGYWKFIIIQSTILFFWILLNVTAYI